MNFTEMTVTCQCGNTFKAHVDSFGVYWCDVCDEYKGGKVNCNACLEPQHCDCDCDTCFNSKESLKERLKNESY